MYICAPTLIYLVFAVTQIFIDTFQGDYNTAFMKAIVMILFSLMLNLLCMSGMSIISWIIVLVPFLFMSVIVTILLVVFGLDPSTGEINNNATSGNLIFSTNSDNNDDDDDNDDDTPKRYKEPIPTYSSDPQYESYKNIVSYK
jgi:amino acid transporter